MGGGRFVLKFGGRWDWLEVGLVRSWIDGRWNWWEVGSVGCGIGERLEVGSVGGGIGL